MSSLPDTLVRYRSDLEQAVGRDARRMRRRRRVTLVAALLTLVAAVALALPIALPERGPSIVERARAALDPHANTILHSKIVSRSVRRDGTVQVIVNEQWQERRPPFAQRTIYFFSGPNWPGGIGGHVVGERRIGGTEETWSGFDTDVRSLLDPKTNTIYVLRPLHDPHALRSAPPFCAVEGVMTRRQTATCAYPFFAAGPRPGTMRVVELTRLTDHLPFLFRVGHRIVSTREAHRIMESLFPKEPLPDPYRSEILALLGRPDVTVEGHVHVGGRDAERITWNSGHSVYLVDAATYDPIELRISNRAGTKTTRFPTYAQLPLTAETQRLVSLEAQHPTARVVSDRDAYVKASERLLPHG